MDNSEKIKAIIDKIAEGQYTDTDLSNLRQLLENMLISASGSENIIVGKNIIGKIEGGEIQIGDRTYFEWNEEAIRKLVEVIQEQSDSIPLLPKELPQSDYLRLQNLLASGRWLEANDRTRTIILKAVKGEKEGWLTDEQIANFPCQVLQVIDRLCMQYSDGRFGFSVQKRIVNECQKDPQAFGDRVSWRVEKAWISASQVCYTTVNVAEGHLPWGIMQTIAMDNAALDAFLKVQRAITKAAIGFDKGKMQLLADFMAFGGFLLGERIDKEEFKRTMEYELSHDEAWWEGERLEELKVRKLFSLLAACPNL